MQSFDSYQLGKLRTLILTNIDLQDKLMKERHMRYWQYSQEEMLDHLRSSYMTVIQLKNTYQLHKCLCRMQLSILRLHHTFLQDNLCMMKSQQLNTFLQHSLYIACLKYFLQLTLCQLDIEHKHL